MSCRASLRRAKSLTRLSSGRPKPKKPAARPSESIGAVDSSPRHRLQRPTQEAQWSLESPPCPQSGAVATPPLLSKACARTALRVAWTISAFTTTTRLQRGYTRGSASSTLQTSECSAAVRLTKNPENYAGAVWPFRQPTRRRRCST